MISGFEIGRFARNSNILWEIAKKAKISILGVSTDKGHLSKLAAISLVC